MQLFIIIIIFLFSELHILWLFAECSIWILQTALGQQMLFPFKVVISLDTPCNLD